MEGQTGMRTKFQKFTDLWQSMSYKEWDMALKFIMGYHGKPKLLVYMHYLAVPDIDAKEEHVE